jgi:hypothetical protein
MIATDDQNYPNFHHNRLNIIYLLINFNKNNVGYENKILVRFKLFYYSKFRKILIKLLRYT